MDHDLFGDVSSAVEGSSNTDKTSIFAGQLGWFNRYEPGVSPADDINNMRQILLEEHSSDVFHVRPYIDLNRKDKPRVMGGILYRRAWKNRREGFHGIGADATT